MGGLMQGWKTWTGAIVLMATGLAKVVGSLSNFPDINSVDFKEGIELIGAGLVVVGIGHKIEKSGVVNVK